jgi:hypothetical protein
METFLIEIPGPGGRGFGRRIRGAGLAGIAGRLPADSTTGWDYGCFLPGRATGVITHPSGKPPTNRGTRVARAMHSPELNPAGQACVITLCTGLFAARRVEADIWKYQTPHLL